MYTPIDMAAFAWGYSLNAFAEVWTLFRRLLEASGTAPLYITAVLIAIAFRLLAAPLVGKHLYVGSDMYRTNKK